jgi:hypothetical protein
MAAFYGLYFGWIILLLLGAYLIGAMYIYAPLKVRRQQSKDVEVHYWPIELPQLPPEVAQAFDDASRGLVACGFHPLGHLTHYTHNTEQNSYVSIWVDPSSLDHAQIIGVCTPSHSQAIRVATLVTFRTEFSDGTAIVTSNSASPGVFPRDRNVSAVRCPGIRDFALLYRFHRARVDRDRAGRTATLDRVKDARTRMQNEWTETYQRLIGAGYYSLDETRQRYVPTLKGAFLMTYRLLPPFKQIQKFRRDRLAERTLRELGFGGMEAFRNSQSRPVVAGAAPASTQR